VAVLYIMPGLLDLSLRQWKRGSEEQRATGVSPTNDLSPRDAFPTPASAPSDYSAPHRRI
jgi:hypothetical protein